MYRNCARNVVVTGFGPFRDHKTNPSWEAIRDGHLTISDKFQVNIITKQVAVAYEEVDNVVEDLWKTYNPLIMVHVGLAAFEQSIRIEQVARHGPYIHDDVVKNAPHKHLRVFHQEATSLEENQIRRNYSCKPCDFGQSKTCLDIDRVCERLNELHKKAEVALPFKKSCDAGLYVCEYIYHKSLSVCDRTVFIHVPDVENFKIEDIRTALRHTIEVIVDELCNNLDQT